MRTTFFVSLPTQENIQKTTQTLNTTNIGFAFSFLRKKFSLEETLREFSRKKNKTEFVF